MYTSSGSQLEGGFVPPLKSSHRIALDAYFDENKHCAFNLDELFDFITGN
jgi:hypothetical protein